MNDHSWYAESLPLYVSGALDEEQRRAVQDHLAHCPLCRSDLELWRATGAQVVETDQSISAPPNLADRALVRMHARQAPLNVFRRAFELTRAQVPLVRSEMWLASAAVMAIGFIVATIVHDVAVLRMLAPMVAAASIAVIYGPESDPALELSLATATSPWKILLARLSLVFGYDLLLALAASLGMLVLLPAETVARLILDWLAPMTFLSAAALVLALWVGTGNAIIATYLAWAVRFLPAQEISNVLSSGERAIYLAFLDSYRQFWSSPPILIALAVALLFVAARLAGQSERHLPHWA